MPAEGANLQEARRLLAQFERTLETNDIDGDDALHDAIEVLSEVASSSNVRERMVALNLLRTYARSVEQHADRLLADIRSATDSQIVRCHHVMLEFERSSAEVPDSHRQKRLKLIEEFAECSYDRLPRPGIKRDAHGPFVASEAGNHFHRPNCKWAREISSSNLIEFETHEQAVANDYRPCKTCRA